MCKCDPRIKTPFCGRGDCQWPPKLKDVPIDKMSIVELRNHTYELIIALNSRDDTIEKLKKKMKSVISILVGER